jgi:hypothetical protein
MHLQLSKTTAHWPAGTWALCRITQLTHALPPGRRAASAAPCWAFLWLAAMIGRWLMRRVVQLHYPSICAL